MRACGHCDAPIDHLRSDAEACELPACRRAVGRRKQLERERAALTAEDRAAIARSCELVPIPPCVPPAPTVEQVRAHLAATARTTDELDAGELAQLDHLDATARRPARLGRTERP